ncbi:hypothetical protein L3Q82_022443 [Scortum barcoo]|uniref:Uncharacterized protein n=1 Tax=Scortum barcoo TaxID=214431 RepID=A0ACB8X1C7_9TELE|nr:hypothetical protein L3Q82_022443 [Scortum barcoo]
MLCDSQPQKELADSLLAGVPHEPFDLCSSSRMQQPDWSFRFSHTTLLLENEFKSIVFVYCVVNGSGPAHNQDMVKP